MDATHIYWITGAPTDHQIWSVSKNGAPPSLVLSASESGMFIAILIDETNIYWSGYVQPENGIFRAPKSGGSTTMLAPIDLALNVMAMDQDNIYWLGTNSNEISSVPKSGGMPTVLLPDGGPFILDSIAVDQENLYWKVPSDYNSTFWKIPKKGGKPEQLLAPGESTPFVIDEERLYWGERHYDGTYLMRSMAKKGAAPVALVTEGLIGVPHGVAVDASCIYWTNFDYKKPLEGLFIQTIPKTGGEPVIVAAGVDGNLPLLADDTGVYWVDQQTHAFMKLAK
jgi:hypothetical protein